MLIMMQQVNLSQCISTHDKSLLLNLIKSMAQLSDSIRNQCGFGYLLSPNVALSIDNRPLRVRVMEQYPMRHRSGLNASYRDVDSMVAYGRLLEFSTVQNVSNTDLIYCDLIFEQNVSGV
jgi:hypothetical protein